MINWREREWGSDYYREHGRMMPIDGIDQLADGDAILLGAVGAPDIPDDVTLWGLLIPIRRDFDAVRQPPPGPHPARECSHRCGTRTGWT